MAAVDPREPALALRFSVTIGSYTIERFTQCDGLTAEYEVEEYREGGEGGFVHRLPVRHQAHQRPPDPADRPGQRRHRVVVLRDAHPAVPAGRHHHGVRRQRPRGRRAGSWSAPGR